MRKPVALLCRQVQYHTRTLFWYRHTTWLQSRKLQNNVVFAVLLYYLLNPEQHTKLIWNLLSFFLLFCVKFFIPFKYVLWILFILFNKFSIITKNLIKFLLFNTYVIFYFFLLINRSCWGGGNLTPRPL